MLTLMAREVQLSSQHAQELVRNSLLSKLTAASRRKFVMLNQFMSAYIYTIWDNICNNLAKKLNV